MRRLGGMVGAAALALTAGCGGGSPAEPAGPSDSASVATDAESSAKPTPKEVYAKPYFEALTTQEADDMARAAKRAAPGSLARAFMVHQRNVLNAQLDGGEDPPVGTLKEKGDGFEACYDDPETGKPGCGTFDDFKVSASGQLAGFSVRGRSLAGRVVLGNGKKVDSPVASVTLLSASQATGSTVTVTVSLRTNDAPVVFYDPSATYRAPNGQQRAASAQSGLSELGANSRGTQAFQFKGPLKFGGTLTLQMAAHPSADEYGDATLVPVKVG